MTMNSLLEIPIDRILVGSRHRRMMGDIDLLAASIEQVGLLQPIGIRPDNTLVYGERRLRAFRQLGRSTIPARVIDVPALVLAEHAENEIRKDFTPSERVAIGKAVEEELGKRQGQRTDLVSEEQEEMFGELPGNCKEVAGKQSAAIAAEKAGFDSEATYRRAKTVTENATPELIEAMDKGDIAISTAAKLASQPPDVQKEAVANPKAAIDLAKKASASKQSEIKKQASTIHRDEVRAEMAAVRALRPPDATAPVESTLAPSRDPIFDTILPNGKHISDGDPRAKFLWGWLLELEDRFLNQAPAPEELVGNFLEFMEKDSIRLIPRVTTYLNRLLEQLHADVS